MIMSGIMFRQKQMYKYHTMEAVSVKVYVSVSQRTNPSAFIGQDQISLRGTS